MLKEIVRKKRAASLLEIQRQSHRKFMETKKQPFH